jgi:hypothetical protein
MRIAQLTVFAIFFAVTITSFFAAAGLFSATVSGLVLTGLFWFWILGAALNTLELLVRARLARDQRQLRCDSAPEWPRLMFVYRWLCRALLFVMVFYGHYGLASLMGYGMALGIASRVENKLILGQGWSVGAVSRAVHAIVYAIAERLAPAYAPLHRQLMRPAGGVPLVFWLIFLPLLPLVLLFALGGLLYWLVRGMLLIPFLLFGWRRERTHQRELVKTASAEGALAWFAYAEPHQRERFFGEGGVLNGLDDAVVVRDWRNDLKDIWQRDGSRELDALIVRRYRLSNMREDLPVIVLLQPDGGTELFRLNRAYRQRFRDGADLLGALEGTIRKRIAELQQTACSTV